MVHRVRAVNTVRFAPSRHQSDYRNMSAKPKFISLQVPVDVKLKRIMLPFGALVSSMILWLDAVWCS